MAWPRVTVLQSIVPCMVEHLILHQILNNFVRHFVYILEADYDLTAAEIGRERFQWHRFLW
jgi:hypothetical protein